MNYEFEIEEILFNELSKKFNIKNKQVLYYYLKLRTYILKNDLHNQKSIINTILNELFITELSYNDVPLNIHSYSENSLINIIENNEDKLIRLSNSNFLGEEFDIDKTTRKILSDINIYVKNNIKDLKHDKYFNYYKVYYSLKKLNEIFGVNKIEEVLDIDGFHQSDSRINKELECERYIHAANFMTSNLNSITEKDLEDYLYQNIELIEEGLKVVGRQIVINDGRIDILAKDKNNLFAIIELKIEEDKSLIWQCLYYPNTFKKKYKVDNVRMITIVPKYPDYLFDTLSKLNNIELFEYNIKINNGKIEELNIYRKE